MSELLDISYYAPTFEIDINGSPLGADVIKYISSVTVTKNMGQADSFSFEVYDDMQGGQFKWLGNAKFKYGNPVKIRLGYVGNLTHSMSGHIQEITPKFFTGTMPSFTVAGSDKMFAVLSENSGYMTYTKKKDSEIVSAIAQEVGLSAKVDTTLGEASEKKEKKGGSSYLLFIKNLAADNTGFEFSVSNGALFFKKVDYTKSADITLTWGKHLLSFTPSLNIANLVTDVVVKWWDQKASVAIEGKASAGSETVQESGKKLAGKIAQDIFGSKMKTITDQKVDSKSDADAKARAILNDYNKEFITGKGKTVGIPTLTPGVFVSLEGLGDWFSGKYYIYKTEHTISSEGYRTTFNGRRNAL